MTTGHWCQDPDYQPDLSRPLVYFDTTKGIGKARQVAGLRGGVRGQSIFTDPPSYNHNPSPTRDCRIIRQEPTAEDDASGSRLYYGTMGEK